MEWALILYLVFSKTSVDSGLRFKTLESCKEAALDSQEQYSSLGGGDVEWSKRYFQQCVKVRKGVLLLGTIDD